MITSGRISMIKTAMLVPDEHANIADGCSARLSDWFSGLYANGRSRRESQEKMAAMIAHTGCVHGLSELEGGTGIGKSYAALLGMLSVRMERKDREESTPPPIVYATGTIALQNQIVDRDLPDLCKVLGEKFTFMLVKGRRRYVCPRALQQYMGDGKTMDLFDGEDVEGHGPARMEGIEGVARDMAKALDARTWNGDLDTYPSHTDDATRNHLTVDSSSCSSKACKFFDVCPFFKARRDMKKVDVLVTNHDLFLSDMAAGGGRIIPCKPEETDYLIDEAHRLPECAVQHFGAAFALAGTLKWLGSLGKAQDRILRGVVDMPECISLLVRSSADSAKGLAGAVSELQQSAFDNKANLKDGMWLYDVPPAAFMEPMRRIELQAHNLTDQLEELCEKLEQSGVRNQIGEAHADRALSDFGFFCGRAANVMDAANLTLTEDPADVPPTARWIAFEKDDFTVNAFPTFASFKLHTNVWSKVRSASLFSATLRSLGNFGRFEKESGIRICKRPITSEAFVSPFDYSKSGLYIAADGADPNSAEHIAITANVVIAAHGRGSAGILVVFTSGKAMRDTMEIIVNKAPSVAEDILMQGEHPRGALIDKHTERIMCGDKSVIFGLSQFGEGIDLPGGLCGHVIIPKLPFAVPTTPMEQARVKWIEKCGGNAFMDNALPATSIKLTQIAGRLVRTENDFGSVVILDHRVRTKKYGGLLIKNLPPFKLSSFTVAGYR